MIPRSSKSSCAALAPPLTTVTCSGSKASSIISAKSSAVLGAYSEGFKTTVFPAATVLLVWQGQLKRIIPWTYLNEHPKVRQQVIF